MADVSYNIASDGEDASKGYFNAGYQQPPQPQSPPQFGYPAASPVPMQQQPLQPYSYGGPNPGQQQPYSYGGANPGQQQQTVVIVNQPQATPLVQGQPQNIRQWSHGLCDCCADCCQCAYAYFCWCCFIGSLATRMDENCCGPCCCRDVYVTAMRTKLRTQHGITGSICEDICVVCWCPFCAGLQMSNELRRIGR